MRLVARIWIVTVIALCLLSSACMFHRLRKDIRDLKRSVYLSGTVSVDYEPEGRIIVAIGDLEEEPVELLDYFVMDRPGVFVFTVGEGVYRVGAFVDENGDYVFQPGEPAVRLDTPIHIETASAEDVSGVDLRIARHQTVHAEHDIDPVAALGEGRLPAYRIHVGTLASLDDERFSRENANLGGWEPLRFAVEVGAGIFFLQEFDEGKVPVLLVHGAMGTPQDWSHIVEKMDRERFQPWVIYYPSGLRFEVMAAYFDEVLSQLEEQYGFDSFFLVAHSAGGLLSRALIDRYLSARHGTVPELFVTLSTPWGGQGMAELGLRASPEPIPVWKDVVPGSAFLAALRSRPLPPEIEYHLFFGIKGSSAFVAGNSDGAVRIASQLDYAAQAEATRLYGFDETHTSILASDRVSQTLNRVMAARADAARR